MEFFLTLLKMIDILLSYTFTESTIIHLKQLIIQHNSMYVRLFNDTLKPKYHFLIHYPTIIEYSGPPRHYWCFRFEGKHKEIKMYACSTSSRKNITLTLAKKFQFKFAHYLLHSETMLTIVNSNHTICSLYSKSLFGILYLSTADYKCYSQIEYNGTLYKRGYYLTKFVDELYLFEILELIVLSNVIDKVFIVAKQVKITGYHLHLEAYEVNSSLDVIKNCVIFEIDDFSGPPINISQISSGKLMIRLKEYFS